MATTANDMPHLCLQEQLDCVSCTASTARELAGACPGLPGRLVAQLFVQIHPHGACARMHRNFARSYAEAMGDDAAPELAVAAAAA